MKRAPSRFRLDLEANASFTLPDVADIGLECCGGTVWITIDDDLRDIVLAPGERFEGHLHRRALVSALGPSCIVVSGSRPAVLPAQARERSGWRLPAYRSAPA